MRDKPIQVDLDAPGIVKAKCEFCGRMYYIDPANLAVMHDLPMCPEFQALDVIAFMVQNRQIKEGRWLSGSNN